VKAPDVLAAEVRHPISVQQAVAIVGSKSELRTLNRARFRDPVCNPKLAMLFNGVQLLRKNNNYSLQGSPQQVEIVLRKLKADETHLLLHQAGERRRRVLKHILDLATR